MRLLAVRPGLMRPRPVVLVALASTLLIVVATPTALAQGDGQGQGVEITPGDDSYGVVDQTGDGGGDGDGTPDGGVTPVEAGGASQLHYEWDAQVINTPEFPDGCWAVVQVGEGSTTPPAPEDSYAQALETANFFGSNTYGSGNHTGEEVLWGRCPPTEDEPQFDPGAAAAAFWETMVQPPSPAPLEVAPGEMIVGLAAYLEIGGDPAPAWTLDNPIGPDVVISAEPRYVVDWGDGTTVETRSQGVPWPGGPGEITHVYDDGDTFTITVDAYWSATWSLAGPGGGGGSLPELPVPTSADLALPVTEVQAVIR